MERQETPGQGDTLFKCHLVNTTLQDLGSVWHKRGQGKDWEIDIALLPRQSTGAVGLSSYRLHQGEQGLLSCGFIFPRKPMMQESPFN